MAVLDIFQSNRLGGHPISHPLENRQHLASSYTQACHCCWCCLVYLVYCLPLLGMLLVLLGVQPATAACAAWEWHTSMPLLAACCLVYCLPLLLCILLGVLLATATSAAWLWYTSMPLLAACCFVYCLVYCLATAAWYASYAWPLVPGIRDGEAV